MRANCSSSGHGRSPMMKRARDCLRGWVRRYEHQESRKSLCLTLVKDIMDCTRDFIVLSLQDCCTPEACNCPASAICRFNCKRSSEWLISVPCRYDCSAVCGVWWCGRPRCGVDLAAQDTRFTSRAFWKPFLGQKMQSPDSTWSLPSSWGTVLSQKLTSMVDPVSWRFSV